MMLQVSGCPVHSETTYENSRSFKVSLDLTIRALEIRTGHVRIAMVNQRTNVQITAEHLLFHGLLMFRGPYFVLKESPLPGLEMA